MGRYGHSDEVAELIAFLASHKSAYITASCRYLRAASKGVLTALSNAQVSPEERAAAA